MKTPANFSAFLKSFNDLVELNLVDIGSLLRLDELYFPELVPVSVNFFTAEISSTLYLSNGESLLQFLLIIAASLAVLIFLTALTLLLGKSKKCCCLKLFNLTSSWSKKIHGLLFWSGTVRLYLELYLDVVLFSTLNLHHIFWQDEIFSVNFSNTLAIINVILFAAVVPIGVFMYVMLRRSRWQEQSF